MAAHILLDPENQHPIIRQAYSLLTGLNAWSKELEAPRQEAILAGEERLEELKVSLAAEKEELESLRERVVLEGIELKRLNATRKRIAELESNITDWTFGLLAARRATGTKLGKAALQAASTVLRMATDIRDTRGVIVANLESDRRTAPYILDRLGASISACSTNLDKCLTAVEEQPPVPADVSTAVNEIRKQLGLIRHENTLDAHLLVA